MEASIVMADRVAESGLSATLVNIEWERIILHLDILLAAGDAGSNFGTWGPEELSLFLVSENYRANGKFQLDGRDGDIFHFSMNITNPGYNMSLPNGIYSLVLCRGENILTIVAADIDLAKRLESYSTIFLHGETISMGYAVSFFLNEEAEDMAIYICCQDMNRKSIDSFNEKDIPAEPPVEIKGLKKWIRSKRRPTIKKIYDHYAAKKNYGEDNKTVLFMSEQSEVLGSNLQAVLDRVYERGLDKEFNIETSARNMVGKGGYGIPNWIRFLKKVADADIIFIDDHCPFMDWLHLREEVKIIQLWHAGAGYKSSGYSRWGHRGSPTAFSCHRQYDYGITESQNIAHFFSEVFGINTERIIPTGMPRMDEYRDPVNREKVTKKMYEEHPEWQDKKIILFAPTFRGGNRKTAYYPYELLDLNRLYETCGDEWIVLFKMHPWISEKIQIPEGYGDRLIDASSYGNINDLFYITELLVTDYSSSTFEFALMKKPMVFFAFDELQYAYSRGFHRDYRPACPGKIVNTFGELMEAIEKEDFEFEKNAPYLEYHYDRFDTGARDRVIDWFILGGLPEEYKERIREKETEMERMKELDFSSLKK